ncbi:hypothetical protein SERLADRAFT_455043 [Serpula lacrymans var. lacrymans S7.9]|uniref:RRM domain-containing protein n=1 Tax=Serpula lacrymans var. lacrymans (strain S7.9) TaxID=578457 RepID=F8ND02_SERL9|nr:uncharacterized protein SERLADRAFT_455043 [Serpula lacrymans var. lacrymans S7.9]EGO30746.1 hypothetical protein SERLADRAFT_455043 [Serpula lacrymans var. lacrymans S7.9]
MSSPRDKIHVDTSPHCRSSRNHSSDTHRTRKSHRSHSRERGRRDRRRDRDNDEWRIERGYRERGRRSKSRDLLNKDRDSGRRERDKRHRGDRYDSHHHTGERQDRDQERRRKRDEIGDSIEAHAYDGRSKRKRSDDGVENLFPPLPSATSLPQPTAPIKDSPNNRVSDLKERSRERRFDDRMKHRDPRDEFDDPLRHRTDRDVTRDARYSFLDEDELEARTSTSLILQRSSPTYDTPDDYNPEEPKEDDSEARSVFVSQLAARLTARDLGYFFEDKLGEGTVMDSRIVTDRLSRRSKGIGYVEFRSIDMVEKAISLSGTVVMGLPVMVQLTESERNKLHPGDGNLNLPPGVSAPHGAMQLYVGSLHFNLTESDIKQVFEPFGELEFVDLHRDPMTGRSKGYAFVQYKRAEDARMALEQMEGFELAGRTLRVNTVHEKGTARYAQQDTLDEAGGGNLNAASRQALMQKLARIEPIPKPPTNNKPTIPQAMQSRSVLLKNMFDPEEETERDWDKDLAEDVKGECEDKYGQVDAIKVEQETQGKIYVKFNSIDSAKNAIQGLNGRWFGGRQVSAGFISDAIMVAHQ